MILNLTPHTIVIEGVCGDRVRLEPHPDGPARVITKPVTCATTTIHGVQIELQQTTYAGLDGLPAPRPGTRYIVSRVVAAATREQYPGRGNDLLVPGGLIRDDDGNVVACRGLSFP